jgi:hypothetical protein
VGKQQLLKKCNGNNAGLSGAHESPKLVLMKAPVERLLYSRKAAAIALSISLRSLDYSLARGEFEVRRNGSSVLITASSLKRWANTNHYRPVNEVEKAA